MAVSPVAIPLLPRITFALVGRVFEFEDMTPLGVRENAGAIAGIFMVDEGLETFIGDI